MNTNLIVKPDLPSTSVAIVGESQARVRPGFGSTVMIPAVGNWGPLGATLTDLDPFQSLPEVDAVYGGADSPLRTAAAEAIMGQNTPGAGGAGGVILYRMATGSAAASGRTLQNATPAAAVRFVGKYKGTFGDRLGLVIDDDPLVAANDRLRVQLDGATVETYSYLQTDITALAAAVAARPSKYIVRDAAVAIITGVALAQGTFPLTAGNDGAAVASADWLTAVAALEFANAGIFAPFDLTDSSVKAALVSWTQQMAANMKPVRSVFGGALGETITDAITDVALIRDPHVVRFGVGTYYDATLDKTLSTSQLAPRIAGILAARGRRASLTRALLGGLSVVGSSGPDLDALKSGAAQGITMARRVSHPDSSLAISWGKTTYVSTTNPAMPIDLWSEPRVIGIFDDLIRRIVAWGDDQIVGDVPVNDDTRAAVRKEVGKYLSELVSDGLAFPGKPDGTDRPYVICEDPGDPALADAVPFEFGFKPNRTANFLIGNGRVK